MTGVRARVPSRLPGPVRERPLSLRGGLTADGIAEGPAFLVDPGVLSAALRLEAEMPLFSVQRLAADWPSLPFAARRDYACLLRDYCKTGDLSISLRKAWPELQGLPHDRQALLAVAVALPSLSKTGDDVGLSMARLVRWARSDSPFVPWDGHRLAFHDRLLSFDIAGCRTSAAAFERAFARRDAIELGLLRFRRFWDACISDALLLGTLDACRLTDREIEARLARSSTLPPLLQPSVDASFLSTLANDPVLARFLEVHAGAARADRPGLTLALLREHGERLVPEAARDAGHADENLLFVLRDLLDASALRMTANRRAARDRWAEGRAKAAEAEPNL